ncbi:MAG: helix-turn-helix domain-containing protein [Pseudonocardiales bacterium]
MTDVQQAVEELAATLHCAVLIEDGRHRPLWWSAQGEVDAVRSRTILQREAPPAAAALVSTLGLAQAQRPIRTPALPAIDMAERWCLPLRNGRQLLGYLWVLDADGSVDAADLAPALECAELAVATLARTQPSPAEREQRRLALLTRLISGANATALSDLIDLEGLRADAMVAVNAPLTAGGWALPGGSSVHIDPAPGQTHTSGRPVPLAQLAVAAQRAKTTLRALRAGADLAHPSWDALGAWHLIATAPADLAPGQLHHGVDVLLEQKRPDLLVTARCVLDNAGDVTASAEQLHIHRTTLYYRLDRIQQLTGVNLRLATGRDDLHLALRLAAYRNAE